MSRQRALPVEPRVSGSADPGDVSGVGGSPLSDRSFGRGKAAVVVAHRGASADEAENTLPAFEAAVRAGADAVEFDVRMTADGVAVVMHDPDVSRTTDGSEERRVGKECRSRWSP